MTTQTEHGWVPEDSLAHRLLLVRRQLGLTQRVAATLSGLTFGEWQSLEDGRAARDIARKITAISERLNVSRDWLMWGGPLSATPPHPDQLHSVTRRYLFPAPRGHMDHSAHPRLRSIGVTRSTIRVYSDISARTVTSLCNRIPA
jgi:transcriptional regulator with XRE-family HTH domain